MSSGPSVAISRSTLPWLWTITLENSGLRPGRDPDPGQDRLGETAEGIGCIRRMRESEQRKSDQVEELKTALTMAQEKASWLREHFK